jgi:uncharacterized protein YjiK
VEALKVLSVGTIPMPEVSGLSVGGGRLFAVSDAYDGLAWAPLAADGRPGEWTLVAARDIADWPGYGQLEAVSVLRDGTVLLMSEDADALVLLAADPWRVVRSARLRVPKKHPLHKSWKKESNSRGEGMLGLAPDRLLVAKEKRPTALVEFTLDAGAGVLVAGRHWPGPDVGDVSDLERTPDGSLALLSDEDRCLVVAPWVGDGVGGHGAGGYGQRYDLPREVTKAEGVAWLSPSVLAVASDEKRGRDNLVLLEWLP